MANDLREYRVSTTEGWCTWWAVDAKQARQKHTDKYPEQTITSVRQESW